ncbi:MAG TPA: MFS transporter, partial [Thermodesulfobacteriota bacterium]|nr:MFS transporter [Thermodesulfobacteriota bacterium]
MAQINSLSLSEVQKQDVLTPEGDMDGYLVSKGYAWYVYCLVFALMLFDFIDRQVIAALFPFFKKEWGVTDAQCGLLVAAVNWSITFFALPAAIMADRWSRKKTVGLMSTIWSLATLACAFTTNFTQLITARFVIGVGEAGYVPAGNALISALFPRRLRSTLIGIFQGAGALGSAAGVMLGGWIAFQYGWRHAFGIVAVPGLIFAVLFFFIKDYKTVDLTISSQETQGKTKERKMTKGEILKGLLGKPTLIFIYFGNIMAFFFSGALANWLPTFFIRVNGLNVAQAGAKAGLVLLVCIFGNYVGGMIADKFVARGVSKGRLLSAGILQFFNFLMFFAAFGLTQGSSQFLFLLLGGFFFTAFTGPAYSSLIELVHPGLRS